MSSVEEVSAKELVELCAVDHELYYRTFFPRAFRQATPPFLKEVDELLWSGSRFVGLRLFRGSSKTTRLRAFTSKRIAYGISHTILFVSASQAHSIKSVEWIRNAVEHNRTWADLFGLRPGNKWTGEEIEIFHSVDEYPIRVLALGITGQIRGINIEDYRPDLIVVDDIYSDDALKSDTQVRDSIELVFGSLKNSLAPPSDDPNAMLAIAQTPFVSNDVIAIACDDPQFRTLTFGCFDEGGQSRWEERLPTADLQADKEAYVRRQQTSIWMREMECRIITRETSAFNSDWLEYWDRVPQGIATYIGVDPASSDARDADYQAIAVVGFYAGRTYLCDYFLSRGKNPYEFGVEFFRLVRVWKCIAAYVESIAYQRVLAWFLKQMMREHNQYLVIHEVQDRRRKADRIIQAYSGRAANGDFLVHESHTEFIEQFAMYPANPGPSFKGKDDLLDAGAMPITGVMQPTVLEGEWTREPDWDRPEKGPNMLLPSWRGAP